MSKLFIGELAGPILGVVRTGAGTTMRINFELDAQCGNGALTLPRINNSQRPTNPPAGALAWNTDQNRVEVYNGSTWQPVTVQTTLTAGMAATGGNFVYDYDGWRIHTFTSNGTFNVSSPGYAEVLAVGGGGGGGGRSGGGGGGGGVVYYGNEQPRIGTEKHFPSTGNHSVTVGIIGGGGSGTGVPGNNGGNTTITGPGSFTTITALGGGGGGADGQNTGSNGGSGGGGRYDANGGTATQPGSATGGFGNPGGYGTSNTWNAGGGGGALMPGNRGWGPSTGGGNNVSGECGDGGIGLQYKISGANKYYAGGGGGGSHNPAHTGGFGGPGGGGNGGTPGGGNGGIGGVDNTGGGGGGGSTSSGNGGGGGAGATGIVIIRYRI
jgi:hypothetical protein